MSPTFQKAALEKLSSPERLDSLMQVTTARGWLALLGILAAIGGALVWGFLGSAPEEIGGTGILLRAGGIFEIDASGSGRIVQLDARPNQAITSGDVIAQIKLPEIEQRIAQAQQQVATLQTTRARTETLVNERSDLEVQSLDEDIARVKQETVALEEQIDYLTERVSSLGKAVDLGLITNDEVQQAEQELAAAHASVVGNHAEIAQLESTRATTHNSALQELFQFDQQIESAQQQVAQLQLEHQQQASTVSPYTGTIIDLLADEGNIVVRGTALVSVELTDRDLEALVFVPREGSRINAGMTVKLSPNGVPWEQFGYMLGTVKSVSDAPIGPVAMNRRLRNQTLVQQFSAGGGAYLVTVTPQLDDSTPTGFKWTSRQGPDIKIGTGTLFTGIITVDEQRPIALVIPALRRWLGF